MADNFFNFIANNIDDLPEVIEREVVDLDFVFWAGSDDFLTFNQVALAQFGITSSQAQPTYTNIDNGVGLFTSRFRKEINDVPIGGLTIDLIACGDVTGHLRFKRDPNNRSQGGWCGERGDQCESAARSRILESNGGE